MTDSEARDLEAALADLAEDVGPEGVVDLVNLFLSDAPQLLNDIKSAAVARDAERLTRSAHTLKSTSATVGVMRLRELCHQIERLGRSGNAGGAASLLPGLEAEFRSVTAALCVARATYEGQ